MINNNYKLYKEYKLDEKLNDLIKILDNNKLDKSNIRYLIRIENMTKNLCIYNNCNRIASYKDIINNEYLCWFHSYEK